MSKQRRQRTANKAEPGGGRRRPAPVQAEAAGPQADLLRLQQQVGNQAVNRMVDAQVQRAASGGEPVDFSGIALEEELPGHPAARVPQPAAAHGSPPQVQRAGLYGVIADVSVSFDPPTVNRSKSAADIAAEHGRPGIAAWTKPHYRISPPTGDSMNIQFNVHFGWDMDLASEYTGLRGQILQDHEMGHVNIGKDVARRVFANQLKMRLEMQRVLNATTVPPAINAAKQSFEEQEDRLGREFDAVDYARMEQAYLGARTPLGDLEAASPKIQAAAEALRRFQREAPYAEQEAMIALSQETIDACGELEADEISLLQYNPDFKTLVELAKVRIEAFIAGRDVEAWMFEFSVLLPETRSQLNALRALLDHQFTWRAPGSEES